jgi:hypothetical protein
MHLGQAGLGKGFLVVSGLLILGSISQQPLRASPAQFIQFYGMACP